MCVPITVIMMIIFAQFESTKAIAILLSANGQVAQFGSEGALVEAATDGESVTQTSTDISGNPA